MRLCLIISFAITLLGGCIARGPAEGRDVVSEGLEELDAFGRAAATYRNDTGRWPSMAVDVADTPDAPARERLERLDGLVRLRSTDHELLVIDPRSGNALFRIGTDGQITMATASDGG